MKFEERLKNFDNDERLKFQSLRIEGLILWYSSRDGNGIVVDPIGNEYYIDDSVINNKEIIREYGKNRQAVSFKVNYGIEDCLCGMDVNILKDGE